MELDPDMQSLMEGSITTQKGTARVATNVKSMSGIPSGTLATIPIDGWVLGNYSSTRSDLINITEWYRPSGEKMFLLVPCKASVTNLTVIPYVVIPPDPDPDPTPDPVPQTPVEVKVNIDEGGIVTVTVNGISYVQP